MASDQLNIRNYWEPTLPRLRDGRLLGMIRAPQFAGQYRSGGYFFMTVSDDGGASWSEPKRTNIFAFGNPADLLQLNDGRVVCTYGRRRPPYGVFLTVSDDGLSWDGTEATLREYKIPQNPRLRGADFPFHIGYASSVQLDSGEILTAYHLFDEEGLQIVEGAIFELEYADNYFDVMPRRGHLFGARFSNDASLLGECSPAKTWSVCGRQPR